MWNNVLTASRRRVASTACAMSLDAIDAKEPPHVEAQGKDAARAHHPHERIIPIGFSSTFRQITQRAVMERRQPEQLDLL